MDTQQIIKILLAMQEDSKTQREEMKAIMTRMEEDNKAWRERRRPKGRPGEKK
jgi:hypothetical protein